jgi:hypothetical protein
MIGTVPFTSDQLVFTEKSLIKKDRVSKQGRLESQYVLRLEMSHPGNQCAALPERHTSFSADIICNYGLPLKGEASIMSADYFSDPCHLSVVMEHISGCPGNAYAAMLGNYNNPTTRNIASLFSLILFIFLAWAVPKFEIYLPSPTG